METLLKTIGRSLVISCLIPVVVFVTATVLVFAPVLPSQFFELLHVDQPDVESIVAFVLVISFAITYVAMARKWTLVRLYEGYHLRRIPFLTVIEVWAKNRRARKVAGCKQKLDDSPSDSELYERAWRRYVEELEYLSARFPDNVDDFFPSRLGNIYRAFEDYPFIRYGMDGVFFWSRLAMIIPADDAAKVDELNNAVIFLLNSSLASMLIGLEVIISNIITLDQQALVALIDAGMLDLRAYVPLITARPPDLRVFVSLICFFLSYLFYHAATATALTYGDHFRTCYDIFRLNLLKALQIDPPSHLGGKEERELWKSIHEYLVLGEGSPYRQKQAETCSPNEFLRTAGRLIWSWVNLCVWSGFRRILEWAASSTSNTPVNTPVTQRASDRVTRTLATRDKEDPRDVSSSEP